MTDPNQLREKITRLRTSADLLEARAIQLRRRFFIALAIAAASVVFLALLWFWILRYAL